MYFLNTLFFPIGAALEVGFEGNLFVVHTMFFVVSARFFVVRAMFFVVRAMFFVLQKVTISMYFF